MKKPGPIWGPVSVIASVGAGNSSRGEHAARRRFWEDINPAGQQVESMRSAPNDGNVDRRMTAMRNRNRGHFAIDSLRIRIRSASA
ncbi:MAG: hypothetical protein WAM76_16350, partial [Pseudolabrys sp.]